MLDATGNITLNRADTFNLMVDNEEGTAMDPSMLTLYVSKNEAETPAVLFKIEPTVDVEDPSVLHFTFTPEHSRLLGKKEYSWIIQDITDGVPETLATGGTIRAEGFAV